MHIPVTPTQVLWRSLNTLPSLFVLMSATNSQQCLMRLERERVSTPNTSKAGTTADRRCWPHN